MLITFAIYKVQYLFRMKIFIILQIYGFSENYRNHYNQSYRNKKSVRILIYCRLCCYTKEFNPKPNCFIPSLTNDKHNKKIDVKGH